MFGGRLILPIAHMEMIGCSCTRTNSQGKMTGDDILPLNVRRNKGLNKVPKRLVVKICCVQCQVFV